MNTNGRKTVLNLTPEWVFNIVIIVTQTVLIAVMIGLGIGRGDSVYWIIFGCLIVSDVFFTFMLLYKVYRARLTLVTLSRSELVFSRAFKKIAIPAEDLVVALCDYNSKKTNVRYALIYDKNDRDGGFLFEVSATKCFKKIADYAPRILLTFVAACTDGAVLTKLRETASPELSEYIDRELEARDANAHPASSTKTKKKKHKKKKKK